MTHRSTRNKLRWQADKAIEHADKILVHLKYLDELAIERSTYINEVLPMLVLGVEKIRESLSTFKEGL